MFHFLFVSSMPKVNPGSPTFHASRAKELVAVRPDQLLPPSPKEKPRVSFIPSLKQTCKTENQPILKPVSPNVAPKQTTSTQQLQERQAVNPQIQHKYEDYNRSFNRPSSRGSFWYETFDETLTNERARREDQERRMQQEEDERFRNECHWNDNRLRRQEQERNAEASYWKNMRLKEEARCNSRKASSSNKPYVPNFGPPKLDYVDLCSGNTLDKEDASEAWRIHQSTHGTGFTSNNRVNYSNQVKDIISVLTEQMNDLCKSHSCYQHRIIKEFNSERIIWDDEVPQCTQPKTKTTQQNDCAEENLDSMDENSDTKINDERKAVANMRSSNETSPSASTPMKNSHGSKSDNTAVAGNNKTFPNSGGRTTSPALHGSNRAAGCSQTPNNCSPVHENDNTQLHRSQDMQNGNLQNNSTLNDYDRRRTTAANSESLQDGNWLDDYVMSTYEEYLQRKYQSAIDSRNIAFIPWYFIKGVSANNRQYADGRRWYMMPEALETVNLEAEHFVGLFGNGCHWLFYHINRTDGTANAYDSLGYIIRDQTTIEGFSMLLESLSDLFGKQLVGLSHPPAFPQKDGHNCGVATLLEMEKFLSGTVPENVNSLNDYRRHIQNTLLQNSSDTARAPETIASSNPVPTSNTMGASAPDTNSLANVKDLVHATLAKEVFNSNFNPGMLVDGNQVTSISETFCKGYQKQIEDEKIGKLFDQFCCVKPSPDGSGDLLWYINRSMLDEQFGSFHSFCGMMSGSNGWILFHIFPGSCKLKFTNYTGYIDTTECKLGLRGLLETFRTKYNIPNHTKWNIDGITSKDFKKGLDFLFHDIPAFAHREPDFIHHSLIDTKDFNLSPVDYTPPTIQNGPMEGESEIPKKSKSRKLIKCGYCNVEILKKNLKAHTRRMHVGLPDIGVSTDSEEQIQDKDIADMECDLESITIEENSQSSTRGTKRPRKDDSRSSIMSDGVPKFYFNHKIAELKNYFLKFFGKKGPETSSKKLSDSVGLLKVDDELTHATNMDEVLSLCTWLKLDYPSEEAQLRNEYSGLVCTMCETKNSKCGKFKFSHTNFGPKTSTQPQQFRNLKSNLKKHKNESHAKKTEILEQTENRIQSTHDANASPVSKRHMDTKFEELSAFLDTFRVQNSEPEVKSTSPNVLQQVQREILNCDTIDKLLLNSNLVAHRDSSNSNIIAIACKTCYTGKRSGLFEFNNSLSDPQSFQRLKKNIALHLKTKTHLKSFPHLQVQNENDVILAEKNYKAGMLVGRIAYKSIVSNKSYQSFEKEVTSFCDATATVGNINHSRNLVSDLRPYFYKVVKDRVKDILATPLPSTRKPSPVTIFADKMTIIGSTLQIIGLVTMIDGLNKAIVLAIKRVFDSTTIGLAKSLVETLNDFFPDGTAKKLLVSQSYDGQYIKMGVPGEVTRQLGVPRGKTGSQIDIHENSWTTESWDIMHLIELGNKDAEEMHENQWVKTTQQTVVDLNSSYQMGKQWHNLQECAEGLGLVVRRPGSFSTTRFAAYKHAVLNNFFENYPSVYATFNQEQNALLCRMNHVKFCLHLSGLVDVSRVLSGMSKSVQNSTSFCWQADSATEDGLQKLNSMAKTLGATPFVTNNENLKLINEAMTSILKDCSFQGSGIFIRPQQNYSTRARNVNESPDLHHALLHAQQEIATFISSLKNAIETRFKKNHSQRAFQLARELFSRDCILDRPAGFVPDSFEEYCSMAINAEFIDEIPEEVLAVEYSEFTDIVHQLYYEDIENEAKILPEHEFYCNLIVSEDKLSECRNVAHLLTGTLVRNKSEAIAESIGSIMKAHTDGRSVLKPEHLNQEVFLHHNAGEYHRSCDWIVEGALNAKFGEDKAKWHFFRTSSSKQLKPVEHSIVVDRIHQNSGIIQGPKNVKK